MAKNEKRNFVRLNKRLTVSYKVIVDKFANTKAAPNISSTETISGNGMLMMSSKDIPDKTKLEMSVEIPGEDDFETAGEVIGRNKLSDNEFEIKIKFIEVDERERDRLASYIIREDVKSKKK